MSETVEAVKVSKFETWVRKYGIARLVEDMKARGHSVTASAVYYWLGRWYEPRGKKVRAMVALSNGELTLQDVSDHFHNAESGQ